jgi:hypothetical protein
VSKVLEVISEFPHKYAIKVGPSPEFPRGRTLEGD